MSDIDPDLLSALKALLDKDSSSEPTPPQPVRKDPVQEIPVTVFDKLAAYEKQVN